MEVNLFLERLGELQTAERQGWLDTDEYDEAKRNIFQKYSGLQGLKLAAEAYKVL